MATTKKNQPPADEQAQGSQTSADAPAVRAAAASATALVRIVHDGETYEPGDELPDLPAKELQALLAVGAIHESPLPG